MNTLTDKEVFRVDHPDRQFHKATSKDPVILGEDVIEDDTRPPYKFSVLHVRGFLGLGFAALVETPRFSHIGIIHYGTQKHAYDKALEDGKKTLEEKRPEIKSMS